jgi:hypothetical protein
MVGLPDSVLLGMLRITCPDREIREKPVTAPGHLLPGDALACTDIAGSVPVGHPHIGFGFQEPPPPVLAGVPGVPAGGGELPGVVFS